jgi:hypothetical protein
LQAGADHATALQRCRAGGVLCYIPLGIGAACALLAASDFGPSAHFGLLCALALTVASGFTALLLPPLLLWSGRPARRRPLATGDDFHHADA